MEAHACPQLANAPHTAPSAALGTSASSSTIMGSLPPSSSTTGIRYLAAASATRLPVVTLPVNMTLSTPAPTNAAPVEPAPGTTCKTPSSKPARDNTSLIFKPVSDVNSLGFSTTAL